MGKISFIFIHNQICFFHCQHQIRATYVFGGLSIALLWGKCSRYLELLVGLEKLGTLEQQVADTPQRIIILFMLKFSHTVVSLFYFMIRKPIFIILRYYMCLTHSLLTFFSLPRVALDLLFLLRILIFEYQWVVIKTTQVCERFC